MHELTMATGNDFRVADLRPFGKAALDQRCSLKDFIVSLEKGRSIPGDEIDIVVAPGVDKPTGC